MRFDGFGILDTAVVPWDKAASIIAVWYCMAVACWSVKACKNRGSRVYDPKLRGNSSCLQIFGLSDEDRLSRVDPDDALGFYLLSSGLSFVSADALDSDEIWRQPNGTKLENGWLC